MKEFLRAFLLCLIACLSTLISLNAQQFQWVHGGGTAYDLTSSGSGHYEQVKYMCTDPNGNIYVLSQVGNDPVFADTFNETSIGVNPNVVLTSYNCNGQMRWAKLLQNTGYGVTPFGLQADSLGNIYVAGSFSAGGTIMYIGNDTTIGPPASNYLSVGLIKFDTSGHFKWIRYVGPNSFAGETAVASLADAIAIDGANNMHYLCYVQATGTPLTPTVTSVYGVYDMAYAPSGTLLSATRLDLDSEWYVRGAVIDPATNKMYVYGEVNQSFGAGVDTFFAAAFDISRNKLWQYFCGHGDDNAFSGIVLDNAKHLHFSGSTQSATFSFNGDSVSRSHLGGDMSVVMTADTNGHVEWFRNFEGTLSVNLFSSITLLPNNKVAAIGTYVGEVLDESGANIVTPPGMDWLPYFVIVDSAGDLQTIQSLYGDGFYNQGTATASDKVGNIYIGGYVTDSIWAGPLITAPYISVGGNTDFFVMKYGVDCSCTSSPEAAYTDTGTHTIGFTYTGTTSGIDSVVWNFGDGSATTTGTTPLHTYASSGTYNACATVYTDCGSDIHCSDVVVVICTTPIASFSDTGTHTIGFTYTGTTLGLDSVLWNYGDGTSGSGSTALHTYTATGTYTVCVTAYTSCGNDSACHTVVVSTTGVAGFSLATIEVYPNPVTNELHIAGIPQNTTYRLLNVTGECVMRGNLNAGSSSISTTVCSKGVYILELTGTDGSRNIVKVVKG